jgi:hypothetical protein
VDVLRLGAAAVVAAAISAALALGAWKSWTQPRWWLERMVWRMQGKPQDAFQDPLPRRYLVNARSQAVVFALFSALFFICAVAAAVQMVGSI